MKAWWGRRSPDARGLIAYLLLCVTSVAVIIVTEFPTRLHLHRWQNVLVGVGVGLVAMAAGLHVRNVAQTDLEMAAMRDAIERLERGE